MSYHCKNPVVIIIFNRPEYTQKVFDQIKKVRPPKLYIVSDGPRDRMDADKENVLSCRQITDYVDWSCEVIKIFSKCNLGCKRRVVTGLTEVFKYEENAIILEDDCIPTEAFFEFCDWGLRRYSDVNKVSIVSGSNLLDYDDTSSFDNNTRAGFSMYINCWGWATWKRTWEQFDSFLSIQELNKNIADILSNKTLSKSMKKFWAGVFRHSIYSQTIWDFYLQYTFFKNSLVSIYPANNLVENIGFGKDSTHTSVMPEFVRRSWPQDKKAEGLMTFPEPKEITVNEHRDEKVIRTIYGYSKYTTLKLRLGNILRYIGVL